MNLGLENKVALVTGASAGLGFAAARVLSQEGAKVAICSRDEMRITAAANKLSNDRSKALPVVCDLSRKSEIDGLISAVIKHFGRYDSLKITCLRLCCR